MLIYLPVHLKLLGNLTSIVTTTAIFIVSVVVCISTMLIVFRFYRHIG